MAYGSFVSEKPVPSDIDLMISVSSTQDDPGFNKFKRLQELATNGIDVFTLNLKYNCGVAEPVPAAASMVSEFNTRAAHVTNGIQCKHAIELV